MPAQSIRRKGFDNLNLLNAKCGTDQFVLEMVGIVLKQGMRKKGSIGILTLEMKWQTNRSINVGSAECALLFKELTVGALFHLVLVSLFPTQSGCYPDPQCTIPNHNSSSISLKHNIIC